MNQIKKNKQNERKPKIENIIDEDFDLGRFLELPITNKKYVNGLNLQEIKNEFLLDYRGDFELNGLMVIGPVKHKTNIIVKNMDDFESYINAIDVDGDRGDVIVTAYVYKLNTPQLKVVKRSAYAKDTDYMQEIVEYRGQNCCIPTSGHCFVKCIK